MATANSISAKYLKIDEMDYFRMILGITLFLLISLIRGFIPVTIGYILNLEGVTSEMAAIFFIIPMISLFVLPYTKNLYRIKVSALYYSLVFGCYHKKSTSKIYFDFNFALLCFFRIVIFANFGKG